MKKKVTILFFAWLYLLTITGFPQTTGGHLGGSEESISGPASGITQYIRGFERRYSSLSMDLWVKSRGSTDSLLITVQSNNDLSDTTGWVNLTNFGGTKLATGHTGRTYLWGEGTFDTTRFIGKYLRIFASHSPSDDSVATDTGTFVIQIQEWGFEIKP